MKSLKIAILGTGNVAWHLASTFENQGHVISHVYDRDINKAEKFALDYFNASTSDSLDLSEINANLFIMALADDSHRRSRPTITITFRVNTCSYLRNCSFK